MSDKKSKQLGINPSTAAGRLVKDILYKFVVETGNNECFQCGEDMSRDTFSIEHKEPWLDSHDPVGLYFDLDNISFSHRSCNSGAARSAKKIYETKEEALQVIRKKSRDRRRNSYCPVARRDRYRSTGY